MLPPSEPSKIIAAGLNYHDHVAELDLQTPERPLLFAIPPNSLAGHGDVVALPPGKQQVEYEAEIAVVVGEQCRNVDRADAMSVIAGFTCANDISNRDDQMNRIGGSMDLFRGKAFDGSTPIGPAIAPPEDVPADAAIRLTVDGELRQESSRDQLIFDVPDLVADVTSLTTLEPGDVLLTGTTAGVGPLADGDEVAIELEGVGTLEHGVETY